MYRQLLALAYYCPQSEIWKTFGTTNANTEPRGVKLWRTLLTWINR